MPIAPSKDYTFGPLEIDSRTGLPYLPEGLVWRVARAETSYVKVSIAYFDGSEAYDFHNRSVYVTPTTEHLQNAAHSIYEDILKYQKKAKAVESLIGLYPPNSL